MRNFRLAIRIAPTVHVHKQDVLRSTKEATKVGRGIENRRTRGKMMSKIPNAASWIETEGAPHILMNKMEQMSWKGLSGKSFSAEDTVKNDYQLAIEIDGATALANYMGEEIVLFPSESGGVFPYYLHSFKFLIVSVLFMDELISVLSLVKDIADLPDEESSVLGYWSSHSNLSYVGDSREDSRNIEHSGEAVITSLCRYEIRRYYRESDEAGLLVWKFSPKKVI